MASVNTAALITKESSKVFTEGLSCGAFRHGPLELVREGFNAVIFTGNDHTRALNETLAIEIADKGGKVLVIGVHELASSANLSSQKIPDVKSELIPILEMIPVQLLTIPLAKAKGFEPATFEHASKITARE